MEKLTGEDLEQALQERNLPSEGKADDKRAAVAAYDEAQATKTASAESGDGTSGAAIAEPPSSSSADAPTAAAATVPSPLDPGPPLGETRLDSDLDKPQVTAPGEAPADTMDPSERASSATPDKGAAALAGHGTVNAVVPLPKVERLVEPAREHRVEEYDQIGPDGRRVRVKHNIDTGETERV